MLLQAATTTNNKQQLTREQLATVATWLYEASLEHLEHGEARVRTFVAKAVGAHAVRTLNETDNATAQTQRLSILVNLVKSIDKHLTRDEMKVVVVVLLLLMLTRVTRTRTIHIPRVPKGPSMIQRVGELWKPIGSVWRVGSLVLVVAFGLVWNQPPTRVVFQISLCPNYCPTWNILAIPMSIVMSGPPVLLSWNKWSIPQPQLAHKTVRLPIS
jgi:hypothetical protein